MNKMKQLAREHQGIITYMTICLFVLVVDVAITFVCELVMDKLLANAVGTISGFSIQYFLASKKVFNSRNKKTFFVFLATFFIGFAVAELVILFSRDILFGGKQTSGAFLISKGFSIVIPFFLTYMLRKKWIRKEDAIVTETNNIPRKSKVLSFFYEYIWLLIPAIASILICLFAMATNGVFPFGTKVSFYWDGHEQMLPYLQSLRQTILEGTNIGFSMESLLGMDNIGLFAYYLSSPINLLVLFFSAKWITEAYTVIMLVKIGLAAFTFAYFVRYHLLAKKHIAILLSIAYGLMSWAISYSYFFMWLDGYIWLPAICASINRLFKQKSPILLVLSYFMLFLSNYYTGFMVAVFSLIYFCAIAAIKYNKSNWRVLLKKGALLIASGLLAFGMVAVIIFPAALQMVAGMDKVGNALPEMDYVYNFYSIIDLFTSMLSGGSVSVSSDGRVKLYQSVLSIILLVAFFINKKYTRKQKVIAGGALLLLFLTMQNNWLYLYLWNLGNDPLTLSFRNAFIMSFVILCLSAIVLNDASEKDKHTNKAVQSASVFVLIGLLIYNGIAFTHDHTRPAIPINVYTVNLFVIIAWSLLLFLYSKRTTKNMFALVIAFMFLLMGAETFYNADNTYESYLPYERKIYPQKQIIMSDILKEIDENDRSEFRVGDSTQMTANDGMLYNYSSGVHHSSTENLDAVSFLNAIGFTSKGWMYRTYFVENLLTDSILGFKYILPMKQDNTNYLAKTTSAGNFYYTNPYALPYLFISNGDFSNISLNKFIPLVQAELAKKALGDEPIYQIIEPLSITDHEMLYSCITKGPVYVFLPIEAAFTIKINGHPYDATETTDMDSLKVKLLGNLEVGDTVEIVFEKEVESEAVFLSQLDIDLFGRLISEIQSKTHNLQRSQNNIFEADVNVKEGEKLFVTIPYSEGWRLYVDGEEIKVQMALNEFMGAELMLGMHQVKLIYTRPGSQLGRALTIISWLIFIAYVVCRYYKKRKIKVGVLVKNV